MLPLTGAIWSSSPAAIRDFPARYLIRFFANHGMLTVKNSPHGGRSQAVAASTWLAIAERPRGRVRCGTPVESIAPRRRRACTVNGAHRFDRVVIAAHPDQALRMLGRRHRRRAVGAGRVPLLVQPDRAAHRLVAPAPRGRRAGVVELPAGRVLHQPPAGARHLPPEPPAGPARAGRLLRHAQPDHAASAPRTSCAGWSTSTPSTPSRASRRSAQLPPLQGARNTYYCGAYHGWGFHEDGCVSGLRAALALGCAW